MRERPKKTRKPEFVSRVGAHLKLNAVCVSSRKQCDDCGDAKKPGQVIDKAKIGERYQKFGYRFEADKRIGGSVLVTTCTAQMWTQRSGCIRTVYRRNSKLGFKHHKYLIIMWIVIMFWEGEYNYVKIEKSLYKYCKASDLILKLVKNVWRLGENLLINWKWKRELYPTDGKRNGTKDKLWRVSGFF